MPLQKSKYLKNKALQLCAKTNDENPGLRKGDIVFFFQGNTTNHVGMVSEIDEKDRIRVTHATNKRKSNKQGERVLNLHLKERNDIEVFRLKNTVKSRTKIALLASQVVNKWIGLPYNYKGKKIAKTFAEDSVGPDDDIRKLQAFFKPENAAKTAININNSPKAPHNNGRGFCCHRMVMDAYLAAHFLTHYNYLLNKKSGHASVKNPNRKGNQPIDNFLAYGKKQLQYVDWIHDINSKQASPKLLRHFLTTRNESNFFMVYKQEPEKKSSHKERGKSRRKRRKNRNQQNRSERRGIAI